MRLSLCLAALGFCGVLAAPSTASAAPEVSWGVHFGSNGVAVGFSHHRGHRRYRHAHHRRPVQYHRYRHHRHRHHKHFHGGYRYRHAYPTPRRVWVAPVYRTVFVGYDSCGNPIYERVLVRRGYYKRVYYHR